MSTASLRTSLTDDAQKLITTFKDEWDTLGREMVAGSVTCHDPATGEVNWAVPDLSKSAIDYAVKRSKEALANILTFYTSNLALTIYVNAPPVIVYVHALAHKIILWLLCMIKDYITRSNIIVV